MVLVELILCQCTWGSKDLSFLGKAFLIWFWALTVFESLSFPPSTPSVRGIVSNLLVLLVALRFLLPLWLQYHAVGCCHQGHQAMKTSASRVSWVSCSPTGFLWALHRLRSYFNWHHLCCCSPVIWGPDTTAAKGSRFTGITAAARSPCLVWSLGCR